jgi:hypothetical protein
MKTEERAVADMAAKGLDLRNIEQLDIPRMISVLRDADVVLAHRYVGGTRVLKGDDKLEQITRSRKARKLAMFNLIVANWEQADVIEAGIGLIEDGTMTPDNISVVFVDKLIELSRRGAGH